MDINKLAEILKGVGPKHHQAYLSVDGADENWYTWYAHYLIDHTDFASFLPDYDEPELSEKLKALDTEFRKEQRDMHWSEFYAREL